MIPLVEFDLSGKRTRGELIGMNELTVNVLVSYDYTRKHSRGIDALTKKYLGYRTVRFKGDKVISRHIRKNNVVGL